MFVRPTAISNQPDNLTATITPSVTSQPVTLPPPSATQTSLPTQATPVGAATSNELAQSGCPVTPIQEDFWDHGGPVAGEFPVWMTSPGQFLFSQMPKVLPPDSGEVRFVEGGMMKVGIFIDQKVEGDLYITGQQLDGPGIVYFHNDHQSERVNESTLKLLSSPPDFFIISSAHIPDRDENPPGKASQGMGPIFPNPGCYQMTFTIADYTIKVTIDLLDK